MLDIVLISLIGLVTSVGLFQWIPKQFSVMQNCMSASLKAEFNILGSRPAQQSIAYTIHLWLVKVFITLFHLNIKFPKTLIV